MMAFLPPKITQRIEKFAHRKGISYEEAFRRIMAIGLYVVANESKEPILSSVFNPVLRAGGGGL